MLWWFKFFSDLCFFCYIVLMDGKICRNNYELSDIYILHLVFICFLFAIKSLVAQLALHGFFI